jgi:tetratricopeptide (TPR) repeat protein
MFWPGKKTPKKNRKRGVSHWIVLGASICTILSSILVLLQYVTPVVQKRDAGSPQWVSTEGPALPDETLILVADFEGLGTLRFDVNDRITETLRREFRAFPGIRVESCPVKLPDKDTGPAFELGWQADAWILIWGRYDDAGITPVFALPQTLGRSTPEASDSLMTLQMRIAEEIGLADQSGTAFPFRDFPMLGIGLPEYVRDLLPRQAVYLASLVAGLRFFHEGDTLNARRALDRCISSAGSVSLSLGLTAAYTARGRLRLAQGGIPSAEEDLTAALILSERNVTARIYRAYARHLRADPAAAAEDGIRAIAEMDGDGTFAPSDSADRGFVLRITGLSEIRSGRPSSGVPRLEEGLARRDSSDTRLVSEGYSELAAHYSGLRRFIQEEQACRAALAVDSNAAWIHFRLGILAGATRRDTLSACRFLEKALTVPADSVFRAAVLERMAAFGCPR